MSPDFRDLLFAFNAHGVEYLVVGAQALAAHGRVRATGDLDVWVRPEAANAKRVIEASDSPPRRVLADAASSASETILLVEDSRLLTISHKCCSESCEGYARFPGERWV